mmetsp:Transcript_25106/g.28721  ORF Transcript_25106/g.28721 Transcript_25106/m.28721 type:complete len:89 (+) Transcript_25106:47-313(+)
MIDYTTLTENNSPPAGCADGGRWTRIKHIGEKTNMLCLGLCLFTGPFTCCGKAAYWCPIDTKDVYVQDDQVYDSAGSRLGPVNEFKLV